MIIRNGYSYQVEIIVLLLIQIALSGQDTLSNQHLRKGNEQMTLAVEQIQGGNLDSALFYIKLAETYYGRTEVYENYIGAINDQTAIYYHFRDISMCGRTATRAFQQAKRFLKPSHPVYLRAYEQLNTYYYAIGNYRRSSEILQEVINLRYDAGSSSLDLSISYQNLGNAFKFDGDFESALINFSRALKIQQDSIGNDPFMAKAYINIGLTFDALRKQDSSILYLEKAIEILADSDAKGSDQYKIEALGFLSVVKAAKGLYQETISHINDVENYELSIIEAIILEEQLADISSIQNEPLTAITSYLRADSLSTINYVQNTPPLKAKRYYNIGLQYLNLTDLNNALSYFQKGIASISSNNLDAAQLQNPELSSLVNHSNALLLLHEKAKALHTLYENNKNEDHLVTAHETFQLISSLIFDIRANISSAASRLALSERSVDIYEEAIAVSHTLYRLTANERYLASAFSFAESNKAQLLLGDINRQIAKGTGLLPDSLLHREEELTLEVKYFKSQQLENRSNSNSDVDYQKELFKVSNELDLLRTQIRNEHPEYARLQDNYTPLQLQDVQSQLRPRHVIIEYFVGHDNIYVFTITKDRSDLSSLANTDSLSAGINALRSFTIQPFHKEPSLAFENYLKNAHYLYQSLVAPMISPLKTNNIILTVVPDGPINFIPFDILLTSEAPSGTGYQLDQLHYLMEDIPISYAYSVTSLYKLSAIKNRSYEYPLLAFAPQFASGVTSTQRSCADEVLSSLTCNKEEIEEISLLTGGLVKSGSEATKQNFANTVGSAAIIHLATHACVNDVNPGDSKIFFTEEAIPQSELLNFDLRAELAVLSACNTGTGQLVSGEGVMSMAKEFMRAGCKSTLMSLWQVDDCVTSEMMSYFYQGLHRGLSKDEALRQARLSYLRSAPKTKLHPYYWAAFAPIGDMSSINFASLDPGPNYLLMAILILILLSLFLFLKRG